MTRPLALVAVSLVAACHPLSPTGTLSARWTTPDDTASVSMPVTAAWCVGPERLDVRASVGDTGLALAVYSSDSTVLGGSYPLATPGSQVQVRPGAAVALRWMSKAIIQGWWGDSGTVTLTQGRLRGLSGEGTAWLTSGIGPDSVTALTFSFRGVRVTTDTLCDAPILPVGTPIVPAAEDSALGVN